jgi:eukaryotic-like serine/threonine-protein kinase
MSAGAALPTDMPSTRAPDLTGIALDGRYELHELIGEGSFGRVYRGRDRRLARQVAVKVIKPWWAEDPDWVRSFEREAQLLASISDPGIVQIFDVGSAPEGLYYVAELVEGESLASRLRRARPTPAQAREIAAQLAGALASAHARRVIHRDVKPANVLISADGRIKVGDFGVARLAEGSTDGGPATIVGTPSYMAPEQSRVGLSTTATDVYSVGVVLYEMLAGRPPFAGHSAVELAIQHLQDPPPPLPPETPRDLAAIVGRALAKDPADRYPDGAAMALALGGARRSGSKPGRLWSGGDKPDPFPGAAHQTSAATALLTRPAAARPRRVQHQQPLPKTRVGEPMSPRRNVDPAARRRRIALLCGVVLLGVGMAIAALVLTNGHATVPNLRGMTKARVRATVGRDHLQVAFSRRFSKARSGTAIGQTPQPGIRVSTGTTVSVVMSAGPPPVEVPQLVGVSAASAERLLGGLKLGATVTQVPAPGITTGTVTRQDPAAGTDVKRGSKIALSVAEPPRLRALTSLAGDGGGRSVPFTIRGGRWEIVYGMGYEGTCEFIFFCSGPSAKVVNVHSGAVVDQFDLNEGEGQTRIIKSGPGVYEITVSPGSDTARWSIKVDDYY